MTLIEHLYASLDEAEDMLAAVEADETSKLRRRFQDARDSLMKTRRLVDALLPSMQMTAEVRSRSPSIPITSGEGEKSIRPISPLDQPVEIETRGRSSSPFSQTLSESNAAVPVTPRRPPIRSSDLLTPPASEARVLKDDNTLNHRDKTLDDNLEAFSNAKGTVPPTPSKPDRATISTIDGFSGTST